MKDEWADAKEIIVKGSEQWDLMKPLIGTFVRTEENVGPNQSKMHTIKRDDGVNVDVWGSTVLDSKLAEVNPGNRIKIAFLGNVKNPKNNRTYKDYSVMVKETLGEDITNTINMDDIPFGE